MNGVLEKQIMTEMEEMKETKEIKKLSKNDSLVFDGIPKFFNGDFFSI